MAGFEKGERRFYQNGVIRRRTNGRYTAEVNYQYSRRRQTFDTIKDAQAWIRKEGRSIVKTGLIGRELTAPQTQDAVAAAYLAKGHVGLTEAVQFYLDHRVHEDDRRNALEYYEEYFDRLQGAHKASREYLRETKSRVGSMVERFADRDLDEITTRDLRAFLERRRVGMSTNKKFVAIWKTFFNAAIREGYLRINPADGVLPHDAGRKTTRALKLDNEKPPGILTPEDTLKLFRAMEKENPEQIGTLALNFFAGLRTEEVSRMRWEYIDLENMEIDVKSEVAKTAEQRFVTIQPNRAAWLRVYGQDSGPVAGGATPYRGLRRFERARRKATNNAGIEWQHNAGRHSYASYHFRQFGEEAATCSQLGHDSVSMFRRHYKNVVKKREVAAAYWEVRPVGTRKRGVIRIDQTA